VGGPAPAGTTKCLPGAQLPGFFCLLYILHWLGCLWQNAENDPVSDDIKVALVDLDAALDQDLTTFGDLADQSFSPLTEYDHREKGCPLLLLETPTPKLAKLISPFFDLRSWAFVEALPTSTNF